MSGYLSNFIAEAEKFVNKYLPIYMDWLSDKLSGYNSFGTLALAGFLAMFFLLVYVFIRNNQA